MMRPRHLFILFSSLLIGGFLFTSGIAQPLAGFRSIKYRVCDAIQRTVEKYLGKPYVWGAVRPEEF